MERMFDKIIREDTRKAFLEYKSERLEHWPDLYHQLEEYITSDRCTEDIKRLMAGDFYFSAPDRKAIPKNDSGALRYVFVYPEEQSILLKLVAFGLRDYEHIFSDNLYSFRVTKHARHFHRMVKTYLSKNAMYVVKKDVKSYVNSIDPVRLCEKLKVIFADDEPFYNFLQFLIMRCEYYDRGELSKGSCGGLGGSPIGTFMMNVYLMSIDAEFEKKAAVYGRYSDDIIMFANSEKQMLELNDLLDSRIHELGLRLNEDKDGIRYPGDSVDILGLKFTGSEVDICDHTVEKFKRSMRKKAKYLHMLTYREGLDPLEAGKRFADWHNYKFFYEPTNPHSIQWARWAFPFITRIDTLKEIDHYAQYCMRYAMTGKTNNARYRVTHEDLQALGLSSMVNFYYVDEEAKALRMKYE